MSYRSTKPPKYGLHKASGQAVVYLDRKPVYLGKHESPESHEAYARIVAEWTAEVSSQNSEAARAAEHAGQKFSRLTINQLLLAYFTYAKTYCVDASGEVTDEYQNMLYAAKPLRKLYGHSLVHEVASSSAFKQATEMREVISTSASLHFPFDARDAPS